MQLKTAACTDLLSAITVRELNKGVVGQVARDTRDALTKLFDEIGATEAERKRTDLVADVMARTQLGSFSSSEQERIDVHSEYASARLPKIARFKEESKLLAEAAQLLEQLLGDLKLKNEETNALREYSDKLSAAVVLERHRTKRMKFERDQWINAMENLSQDLKVKMVVDPMNYRPHLNFRR